MTIDMRNILIRRPCKTDIEELRRLFMVTIRDNFEKEGMGNNEEGINGEVEEKNRLLQEVLGANGADRFFLVACDQEKIVGTIVCGPCSTLINECTGGKLKGVMEIGTVYVLPKYQKKGIGTLLLNAMYIVLLSNRVEAFCLDSGYKSAQLVWHKKFGQPDFIIKDYWGEGFDHMIWYRRLDDISIIYKTCVPI